MNVQLTLNVKCAVTFFFQLKIQFDERSKNIIELMSSLVDFNRFPRETDCFYNVSFLNILNIILYYFIESIK